LNADSHRLADVILGKVRAHGPMTFDRFMDLALNHPTLGYYSSPSPPIGPEGDYYTSSDVSPLFGAAVGRQLHEMWLLLGKPRPFHIFELGAGKGLTAADMLGWAGAAHPDWYSCIEYLIHETGSGLRAIQGARLHAHHVRWVELDDLPIGGLTGCILSNEVADALPFHRVRWADGELHELWTTERDGALDEVLVGPSTAELASYLQRHSVHLEEGWTAEIGLRAGPWMARQVEALARGFVLTIDYGDRADKLYSAHRPDGTLRCYHRHKINREPFKRVGQQDVTAHVNFSELADAARTADAEVAGYTTQAYFLASLGIGEALLNAGRRSPGQNEFARERAAVEELIQPDGLGSFRVLVCSKNVGSASLRGLALHNEHL